MRVLAAVVLGYFLVVGKAGSSIGAGEAAPKLDEGMTRAAIAELDRAIGIALEDTPPAYDAALDSPKRVVEPGSRVFYIPGGCRTVSQPYNLMLHYHGAPTAMEPAFERSGIEGVLVIFNLGIGSGKYEDAYADPGAFDRTLDHVSAVVHKLCPNAAPKASRIALSGWSAGYGAVMRIIDRQRDAARVDAVLLSDGMHCGFEPDGKADRRVSVDQMAPFTFFAEEALAGHKLMAVTHSSIATPYASTTETSDFLLAQLGVSRIPQNAVGPRPSMTLISRADAGNLHVEGYAGQDKAAHADQLHAFGDTLMPYLKARWSAPRG